MTDEPPPSVWTRPARRKRTLSRAQIVAAAIALLDAEGVAALSMRRLSADLDAGATSLYRHVASKDELLELVIDEVHGELEVPELADADGWREAITVTAHSVRSLILRHPWVVAFIAGTGLAYLGPNMMRLSEKRLAVFEAAGFELAEAERADSAVFGYVLGTTTSEAALLTMIARSGHDQEEWLARLWPAAEAAAAEYPRLRRLYAEQRHADLARLSETNFGYGLDALLDGLRRRLDAES